MIFIGDTHGIRPVFEVIDKNKIENSNLIHVGDFGLGFEEITKDVNNLKILDEMLIETNNYLYVIRGNHDNPIFWDKSKGLNLPKFHNLRLVDDYTAIPIEGKLILFVGGAISIDRTFRVDDRPYPSWWKDEEFKLNKDSRFTPNNIDIVVTHTAPHFCMPISDDVPIVNNYHAIEKQHGNDLKSDLKIERHNLTQLYETIIKWSKPKLWFYGHFHTSYDREIDGIRFIGLSINELKEIN